VIPFALILFLLQILMKRELAKRPKIQIPQSEKLFKDALKQDFSKPSKGLFLLEQAFGQRLLETGKEQSQEIQAFILKLQALQYSQHKEFHPKELKKEARDLFYGI
jgi:hypothetical protein